MNTEQRLEQIEAEIDAINLRIRFMAGDEMSQAWIEENDALLAEREALMLEWENIHENG